MSRSKGTPLWLLLLLALFGVAAVKDDAKADDDDDGGDDKPPKTGPGSCRLGQRWDDELKRCVDDPTLPPKPEPDDDDCPEGMVKNLARLKLLGSGLQGAKLEEELKKYPLCVPATCPVGFRRNEYGVCVADDVSCLDGQHYDEEVGACVDDVVVPPPPEGPDPTLDDPTIFNDYPTPGTFYQVVSGDYELGVAKKYVASCLFLAAKARGFTDEEANGYASTYNKSATRYAAISFFSCRPQNDMRLGTYKFTKCNGAHSGGCTHPGTNGRGIPFTKIYGDTEARARAGMPWRRGPSLGSPGDKVSSSATAIPSGQRVFPLIWLPEPDYDALFESNGSVWLPSKRTWAGGTTRADMPPRFAALGFEGLPDGVEWGC